MRKAGKKDLNQAAIVAALRAIGCEVLILNQEGVPDLLVGRKGKWVVIEVKRPRGHLTSLQAALWRRCWFPVVSSVDEALALFSVKV
jgi:Holliday junction resolvase